MINETQQPTQITLSPQAERAIILSQLTEKSAMLIGFDDIAYLTAYEPSHIQKTISKRPDFPSPVKIGSKNKLFVSGDVIRWIKRNAPRFH